MDFLTPLGAATAVRLGGAAVRGVASKVGDFSALLTNPQAADSLSEDQTSLNASELLDQAQQRIAHLVNQQGLGSNQPLQVRIEGGEVTEVTPPGKLADTLRDVLNNDQELLTVLDQLPGLASDAVLKIDPQQPRLTAESLTANILNSSGGYPNW